MSRSKVSLKHIQRCVLSDVLPYEVPLTFSNRYFYKFIVENKIELTQDLKKIVWEQNTFGNDISYIVKLLFGIPFNSNISSATIIRNRISVTQFSVDIDFSKRMLQPLFYKVRHKDNDFRELAVCHPLGQLYLVAFYKKYKEIILYYCKKSNFSIRYPDAIATHVYFNDKLHIDSLGDEISYIEEYEKEYENIRSFFIYKEYSNVYKFYESYSYRRCEKKFCKLLKLDVSKCFDSIYTHSIAWAILGKEIAKRNLSATNHTFSGEFDRFMQTINYRETNGIIIGPEFSRIFAELILQSIDNKLEVKLLKEGLYNKLDYRIFRYVDDFFIFYNEDKTKDVVVPILQSILRDYKLYLNMSKEKLFEKPIVTEISIAKHKISELLENELLYNLELDKNEAGEEICLGRINIRAKKLIIGFKTIVTETNVNTNDILAYTLAIIERKIQSLFKAYTRLTEKRHSQRELIRSLGEILDFVFFIYSFSSKVSLTIKLCRIISLIIKFCKSKSVNVDFKHMVFNIIFENVTFFLKKNKSSEFAQVENLYLITILSELGRKYKVNEALLAEYFCLKLDTTKDSYKEKFKLSYFSIMFILFYIKCYKKYNKLKSYVISSIIERIKACPQIDSETEVLLLTMDSLACPYIENSDKEIFLDALGISDPIVKSQLTSRNRLSFRGNRPIFFFKWTDFDFSRELDAKQCYEVY